MSPKQHGGFAELAEEWQEHGRDPHTAKQYVCRQIPPEDFVDSGRPQAQRCARDLDPETYPRIVDFGCGPGRVAQHLAVLYEQVYAVDIAPAMLEQVPALPNLDCIHDDGTHLVEKIGEVDGIYSMAVLMHNRRLDVTEIFREFHSLLRPGGRVAFQLPIYEHKIEPHTWTAVGQWSLEEIHGLADETGFVVVKASASEGSYRRDRIAGKHHFSLHVFDRRDE